MRRTDEELKSMEKCFQYFECGSLASSPSCSFQCNLIQFDVDRDLNLNIIVKKRPRKRPEIHLSSSSWQLCFDFIQIADQRADWSGRCSPACYDYLR